MGPAPARRQEGFMNAERYVTRGGIAVKRIVEDLPIDGAIEPVIDALDVRRGVLLTSSYEYPGRYTRWDMGFVDPPLVLTARERHVHLTALNERGRVLLPAIEAALRRLAEVTWQPTSSGDLDGLVAAPTKRFAEEERSKQPSVFTVLRALIELFQHPADAHLGLYGAFGYDLAFQFEPIRLARPRPADQRDLVLYLPDELTIVDHRRERAIRQRYEFEVEGRTTVGLPHAGAVQSYAGATHVEKSCDHAPGEYADGVRVAR